MSSYFSTKFQQVFKDKSLRVNFNTAVYNGSALGPNSNDPNTSSPKRMTAQILIFRSLKAL